MVLTRGAKSDIIRAMNETFQRKRIYEAVLEEHLRDNRQMAFLTGPRQCGKTTLAKALSDKYFTWDDLATRRLVAGDAAGLANAADLGIAGKDILLENRPDLYELLDLHIGVCRMAVAAPAGFQDDRERTLRVATKFPTIAGDFYAAKARDVELIRLNGSIEIAPILGLSDVIVDIVETGTTLKENGLEPFETIVDISARLIANRVSYKFKNEQIRAIDAQISALLKEGSL